MLALPFELARCVPSPVRHCGILLDDLVHLRDRAIDLLDGMLLPARRVDRDDTLAYLAENERKSRLSASHGNIPDVGVSLNFDAVITKTGNPSVLTYNPVVAAGARRDFAATILEGVGVN